MQHNLVELFDTDYVADHKHLAMKLSYERRQNFQQWSPNSANNKMLKGEKIAPGGFTIWTYTLYLQLDMVLSSRLYYW